MGRNEKEVEETKVKKVYVQNLQNGKQTKPIQTGKNHRWLQIAL